MSAVGSRSHRYSAQSSSTNVSNSRRLSAVPYANSPVNTRFSDRRLSVAREQFRSSSRSDDQSTEMITIALAKAQNAVLLDQRNNVTAALDGYSQCCAILAEVIAKETDSDDITRLRQIHDTYSVRMHVLSTMQIEPNPHLREMPPLPTQAHIDEFEDEDDDEEILTSFRLSKPQELEPLPAPESRFSNVRPLAVQTTRPALHRSSSSRDSTGISRHPPSARKTHTRTSSFTRTHSKQNSLGSLEQILTPSSGSTLRPTSKKETMLLPDMNDEEMDDAAFLERITRGFMSDEEILDDETARPSTSSTGSSYHHRPKKPSEGFVFEQIPSMIRTESEDFVLPSPRLSTPRQPSPVPRPKHDRARNTSSPLPQTAVTPQTVVTTPRPASAKKSLSVGGSQPMAKSLSANNAIPNSDEFIVPGNPDAAPAVPPKIKKRPHLIRVVSEQTMRTNSGVRISTFDLSPGSPPSTGSILTPGTTTSSIYTDIPSAKNLIIHDRDGAVAPEDPPEDPYLRPYWLMRALALSMKNQKGAYINSRLFIPQGVWVFKGVKLKATEEKISCFYSLTSAVRQVLDTDYRNFSLLVQEVANLEGTMENVQQNLMRKLDSGKTNGSNGTNGDSRAMTRKMSQSTLLGGWGKRLRSKSTTSSTVPTPTSGSGKDAEAAYPNAILSLFECALMLEQKFETLAPQEMPIKTQLRLDASRRRIAEFFANIVIRLILQDLAMLMQKHVKRVNEWIMS